MIDLINYLCIYNLFDFTETEVLYVLSVNICTKTPANTTGKKQVWLILVPNYTIWDPQLYKETGITHFAILILWIERLYCYKKSN